MVKARKKPASSTKASARAKPVRAKYGQKQTKHVVWSKAKPVRGKDPKRYRRDPTGKVIYKAAYGKTSAQGWQVDHIKPKSRGGSNDIRNLQALSSKVNLSKGNSLVKRSRHSKR